MGIGKLNNLRSAHVTELNQPLESNSSKRVFLSPEEFAQLSGLSVPTIHRYLKSGRLPFNQPGGHRCRILIHKNALISSGKTPSVNSLPEPSCTKQSQTKVSGPEPAWKKKHKILKSKK
ncbi:MAG: helix-turn-helix domain-containing protein [Planctomycetes bacterium]|nr:helix-turn-helix domain-containing protein [Planctomycetota bacterium]MCH9727400.1 helix-turn-helix domain-containing protein [Planctomycetota bacterium]MCH9775905.1 helix-turn-helix domain-containing protein [Planctomycetota bacterium]